MAMRDHAEAPDAAFLEELKKTLNLPHTDFPIRPQHKIDDAAVLDRWERNGLYQAAYEHNKGAEKFVLHDGPPYANGNIHLGHAYNKILKDILTKAYRMSGYHVPVKPGWDCHGLPIEHRVTQENPTASGVDLKRACRAYASRWIDVQRTEFKKLGVLMDWDRPYITMDYGYEASIVRAFGALAERGFIERKHKTVAWCASCATTLAVAEIEYQDRKDPSLFVKFILEPADAERLFQVKNQVAFLVWTTTPWTLPLNRAVALKLGGDYSLLRYGDAFLLVGSLVVSKIAHMLGIEEVVHKKLKSNELEGLSVRHPFIDMKVPVILDDAVGIDEGTACVHIAPGCGATDYEMGVKNRLEIYSPITPHGTYDVGIMPTVLEGMSVQDGQIWVIKELARLGTLVHKTTLRHSYPHCWRCHQGLIFRATRQWFFDLEHEQVKKTALASTEEITFAPASGKNFLKATISSRWEWCLSRQRVWGVPIPALLCVGCDCSYITASMTEYVAQRIAEHGVEFWDTVSVADLIARYAATCNECGSHEFKKESDILDVWFDAGISHYAVLSQDADLAFPAQMYLEGVDQYRGWYQSSLLTAIALTRQAPMKSIMCHGFTVDEQGRKMSKSIGNVVAPQQIIDQLGLDGLRLWVASIGHDSDAVVSEALLKNVGEVYRKIRNTCRFLLQNIYDFDLEADGIASADLLYMDRMALVRLNAFQRDMRQHYLEGNFTAIFHGFAEYTSVELSSLYLDVIKDRLYVEQGNGLKRRSAQTVVWYLLDSLTKLIAPVLSCTAELLSDYYQKNKKNSIHLQPFVDFARIEIENGSEDTEVWDAALKIRSLILKALEEARIDGLIKHSLEASVVVTLGANFAYAQQLHHLTNRLHASREHIEEFFKNLTIVSDIKFDQEISAPGILVQVKRATGVKCPRCWHWTSSSHCHDLCARCEPIVALYGNLAGQ